MFNQQQLKAIPDVVNGYKLGDYFSVVLPKERTNLVSNPSFETNTTGYTSQSGATLTRTTVNQRHGIFSLQVKPGLSSDSGVYYTTPVLTAGLTYAFSFDVFIQGGRQWKLRVSDNVNDVGVKSITGQGYWQRITLVCTPVTTGAHRLYLQKNGSSANNNNTDVIFTDGWQVELCASGEEWPTTYIDGDQSGFVTNQIPPAYYWNGTPHASTSTRSGQTRAGGRLVNLREYGFRLMSIIGLGIFPLVNSNTPYALVGGANYQRTIAQSRMFTLAGAMLGRTAIQIKSNRQRLERDLDAHLSGLEQPILLKYMHGDCDSPDGEVLDVVCLYNAGLSGVEDNYYQERIGLQFVMFDPFLRVEGEKSVTLDFADNITGGVGVVKRGINGVWSGLSTGVLNNASVLSIVEGPDGSIYIGGTFTSAGGVGSTNLIARWDGTQFNSVGGGLGGGQVNGMAFGSDGKLYVAGSFTSAGGIGAVNRIAVYNPSTNTWAALGTGLTGGNGNAIVVGGDNSVYVTGDFTLAGGVANTVRIARWDGVSWNALGTGLNGTGIALAFGVDGFLYTGGGFASAGGVANTGQIARWTGSVWQSLSSGATVGAVNAIAVALDGTIYAGGAITSIGGTTVNYVAKYNGSAWSALGTGLGRTNGSITLGVNAIAIDKLGNVYVGGAFNTAGGLTLPDFSAVWTGTAWVYVDADLAGVGLGTTINSIAVDHIGNVYFGYNSGNLGTTATGGQVVVNNRGNIRAEPVFIIDGPSRLVQVVNFTTGRVVYLNITLLTGERVTLTLKQGNLSFISNFRGNLLALVLPGSSLANFELAPGNNAIGVFMLNSSGNAGAYLTYREAYSSISGSVRQN